MNYDSIKSMYSIPKYSIEHVPTYDFIPTMKADVQPLGLYVYLNMSKEDKERLASIDALPLSHDYYDDYDDVFSDSDEDDDVGDDDSHKPPPDVPVDEEAGVTESKESDETTISRSLAEAEARAKAEAEERAKAEAEARANPYDSATLERLNVMYGLASKKVGRGISVFVGRYNINDIEAIPETELGELIEKSRQIIDSLEPEEERADDVTPEGRTIITVKSKIYGFNNKLQKRLRNTGGSAGASAASARPPLSRRPSIDAGRKTPTPK